MSFSKQVILTHSNSKSQPSNGEELPNGRRSASSNIHCFPQYLSTTYSFLDRNNLGFHAHHRFSNSKMPFKETQETLPLIAPTRTRLERLSAVSDSVSDSRAARPKASRRKFKLRMRRVIIATRCQTPPLYEGKRGGVWERVT